jgi:hypothetical protein
MPLPFRTFAPLMSLAALALGTSGAQATTLNFDDVADGTVIDTAYAGVTFSNPLGGDVYARSTSFAASATNVVSIFQTGLPPFNASYGAVDISFATLQHTVSVDAAAVAALEPLGTPHNRPYLQAFDSTGHLLQTVYFSGTLPTNSFQVSAYETLSFTGVGDSIAKIRISGQQGAGGPPLYALFDNVTFTSTVPEPASLPLLVAGLAGVGLAARRRMRQG